MAKKRKSDATRLDEVDRTMYTTFCSGANSLSQLYTQAMNQQRLSFQAGERHALEKLYNWIRRQQEDGSRMTTVDIIAYIQNELEYGAEEPPMSPRLPLQHQHTQTAMHLTNSGVPVSSNSFGPMTAGQGLRSGHSDHQSKNSVFSNALSSPVRRSLQHYHLAQGGNYSNNVMPSGNGPRNNEINYPHHQHRDSNPPSSNDSSMDMHADSPGHESPY
uniref:Holocarboxylase synthetase n=1 Tax=Davidia involucrata TaxID=16924 RepID=A0A5B7AHE4_DAVIN